MYTSSHRPSHKPPFDATSARRLRQALGMAHTHVSYGIWAAYGLDVSPGTVAAWELGEESPTETELTALAGALWCSPGDLLGAPSTLREHRLARGMTVTDLALRIGMEPTAYELIEQTGHWTGNDRQATALGEALALPLPAFIEVTDRAGALAELLRNAVTTRWQAYVKPVTQLVPLPRQRVGEVLQFLHAEYQTRMLSTVNWGVGGSSVQPGDEGRAFLDEVLELFWERLYA
ncbi:XRE family transcriptional regulator [Streptomyces sp. 8N706]|uniref:XRE family transcriptional regulator n=1 Tax=Streptomyces sp. 8N706 TaxID=3457416 RepID=UPI003FD69523